MVQFYYTFQRINLLQLILQHNRPAFRHTQLTIGCKGFRATGVHEKALERSFVRSAMEKDRVWRKRIHLESHQSDDTEGHQSTLQGLSGGEQDSESPHNKNSKLVSRLNNVLSTRGSIMALVPVDTNDASLECNNVEYCEALLELDSSFQITNNSPQVPDMMWIEELLDIDS